MTASCMHVLVEKAEDSAVIPSYRSTHAGFIAIQLGKTTDPTVSIKINKVKAGAYVWLTKNGDIVLDSYEYKGEGIHDFLPLVEALSKHLAESGKQLFIGTGGKTPEIYTADSGKESLWTARPEAIDSTTSTRPDSTQVYVITPGQK